MKSLNFNSIEKKFLTVTLNDEENTTLLIMSPTKKVLDSLMKMQGITDSKGIADEQIDSLYEACATIMSRNKGKVNISKDKLENIFDIEDLVIFFKEYMSFIHQQMARKN